MMSYDLHSFIFSSSGSWCFRDVPDRSGGWNSAPGWDPEVAGWKPCGNAEKENWNLKLSMVETSDIVPMCIYIYTYIHTLWASPILRTTQVECRLKRRKCGMERVVFDGFRQFWNLQSCSIFHRWFPWGNQHGNVICCKKAVEHSCTPMLSFRDTLQWGSRWSPLLPGQREGVAVMVFTWTSVNIGIGHISTWWLWHWRRQAGCKMWPFIRRRSSEWKRRCLSLKNVEGWEHLWGHWYAMIRV